MRQLIYLALIAALVIQVNAFRLNSLFGRRPSSSTSSSSPSSSSGRSSSRDGDYEPVSDDKAKSYLQQFGYVGPSQLLGASPSGGLSADLSDVKNIFKSAIRKFQEFAGLTPTGELDSSTKKKMAEPRCGMLDVQALTSFDEPLYKWSKTRLTYSLLSYSPDLPQSDIRKAIRKAFQMWSRKSPLEFEEVSNPSADIKVKFSLRDHGDPWPFDGHGGVLAHATMPTNGMLHFDEDENWVYMDAEKVANRKYTDLLPVAVHEVGHILGLSHSKEKDSIMAPFYHETVDSDGNYVMPTLQPVDIKAIQAIYGPRRGGSSSESDGSRRGSSGFGSSTGGTDNDFGFGSRGSFRGESSREPRTTTERTTTKSFFGSLWSSWIGGGRSSPRSRSRGDETDTNNDDDSGRRTSGSGRGGSPSGRRPSNTDDEDIGFSSGSDTGSSAGGCPSSIDAFTTGFGGVWYMFKDSKVYEIRGRSVQRTHSLRTLFPNGPIYVEAALVNPQQQTIALFQSYSVYVFKFDSSSRRFRLLAGYPKRVNGFNPVGAMVWSDGHQFLFSRNGEFAVYDDYWNKVRAVNKLGDYFPGFPTAAKGGTTDGGVIVAFKTARVYRYNLDQRSTVGNSMSISDYLGC